MQNSCQIYISSATIACRAVFWVSIKLPTAQHVLKNACLSLSVLGLYGLKLSKADCSAGFNPAQVLHPVHPERDSGSAHLPPDTPKIENSWTTSLRQFSPCGHTDKTHCQCTHYTHKVSSFVHTTLTLYKRFLNQPPFNTAINPCLCTFLSLHPPYSLFLTKDPACLSPERCFLQNTVSLLIFCLLPACLPRKQLPLPKNITSALPKFPLLEKHFQ